MRVAVLASSSAKAKRIIDALEESGGPFTSVRIVAGARLASFDVVVADSVDTEEFAGEGPPVVLIEAAPPDEAFEYERVRAVLPPDFSTEELAASVTAASLEMVVLTPMQARQMLPRRRRTTVVHDVPAETLTARELEVLRMMADGLPNKEVAARLGISGHTAKFHVAQILAKLRAASRAEAVALGIRRGMVPL